MPCSTFTTYHVWLTRRCNAYVSRRMEEMESLRIARDERVCEPNKLNAKFIQKYVGNSEDKATFLYFPIPKM